MLHIAWSEIYAHPLPDGHRFPMAKYDLIPEQLIYEGTISDKNLFAPEPVEEAQLLAVHEQTYWNDLRDLKISPRAQRKTGFPHSDALIDREIRIMQGTLKGAEYALKEGVSLNVAGGTHHAFVDRGEGFCLLNDIAIAARYLLKEKSAKQVLVVDLDVHQGNGTASIFKGDSSVFTFSMHGKNNYPMHKEKSDLDVELPDGIGDAEYLKLLNKHLPELIEQVEPDFIFYQSGVDVLKTDKLGRMGLSLQGCKERDRFVLEECKKNKIPLQISMGGGYSEKLSDIVEAHANTFRLTQEIFF